MTPDEYSVVNLLMREKLDIYQEDEQIDTESVSNAYSDDFEVESMHRSPSLDMSRSKNLRSPDRNRELELEVEKYKYQYETQKEANRELIIKQAHMTHTQIEQQLAQVQKELMTTSNPARIQQLVAQMQNLVTQAKNSLTTGLQYQAAPSSYSALDSPSIARVRSETSSISEDLRSPHDKPSGMYDAYQQQRKSEIEEDIYSEDFQSESQSMRSPSPVRSIQSSIYDDDWESESKVSVGRPKISLTKSSEISEEISGTMGSGTLSGTEKKKGIRILDKASESDEISEEISGMLGSHAFSTQKRSMGSMGSIGEEIGMEQTSRSKSSEISEEIDGTASYASPSKASAISDSSSLAEAISSSIHQQSTLSPDSDSKYDVNTLSSYSRSRPIKASSTISEELDYSEDFESESALKLNTFEKSRQLKQSGTITESIDEDYSETFESESQSKILESMVSRKSGRFVMQSGEISIAEDIAGESAAYEDDFDSESQVRTMTSGRKSGFHGSSVMEVSEAIPSEYSDDFESASQSQVASALVSGRKLGGLDVHGSSQAFEISEAIPSEYTMDYESESQAQSSARKSMGQGSPEASIVSEYIAPSEYSEDFDSESHVASLSRRSGFHGSSIKIEDSREPSIGTAGEYSEDFDSESQVGTLTSQQFKNTARSGEEVSEEIIAESFGDTFGASSSQQITLKTLESDIKNASSKVSESYADDFESESNRLSESNKLDGVESERSSPSPAKQSSLDSPVKESSIDSPIKEQSDESPSRPETDESYISEEIDTYEDDYEDDFEAESVEASSVRQSAEDIFLQSASSYRSEEDMEAQSGDIEWVITLGKKDSPRDQ